MTAPSLLDELEEVVRLSELATPGPFVVDDWGDVTANGEDVARIATPYVKGEPDANLFASAINFIRTHHTEIADMAKRLEAAERDARGEREETWEIWEYGMCVAGADDLCDAQHYLTMYAQDGPAKLVRVISYRETVTPDAIAAALQDKTP